MPEEPKIDALLAQASAALKQGASDAAAQAIDEKLKDLAASLALEWLVNERRFESQGQQTEAWLARLYEEIYTDEKPEAGRIYGRLDLPLARSQYLARQLRTRQAARWRTTANAEVLKQLAAFSARASEAVKAKRPDASFEFRLSKDGVDALMAAYDRSVDGADGKAYPPQIKSRSPAWTFVAVTAASLPILSQAIAKDAP